MKRLLLATLLGALLWQAAGASAGPPLGGFLEGNNDGRTTYLSRCSLLRTDAKIWNCYVTRLLADVEKSGDPAHQLPRIDVKVRAGGGYLEIACHMMMHQVGQLGPDGAIKLCMRAPTRYRSYTCVHTLGHAYMRLYHEQLPFAVQACRALPASQAPDCAQGAYHDYWLSIAGRDATTKQHHGTRSARALCAHAIPTFVRPCWYRYFLEMPPKQPPTNAAGVRVQCTGLVGRQRAGCI